MQHKKIIAVEIILVLASVLIFRGAWLLLDQIPLMSTGPALLASLVFGIVIAVPILHYIIKNHKKA